jgi:hypothetical protein
MPVNYRQVSPKLDIAIDNHQYTLTTSSRSKNMVKKAKLGKGAKCEKCNLEFPDSIASEDHKNKAFVWEGKILCEDCLVMQGGNAANAVSLADFEKNQDKAKPHDW